MNYKETICAIASSQGGAIGVVRVSGAKAFDAAEHIFRPIISGKLLHIQKGYTQTYGRIFDPEKQEEIDDVLVSVYHAPHSYTGEDSVEITCHGSAYILQRVIQLLIDAGCKMAQPGEYTQRAFLNGKMDLTQAEAVADLIASSSAATHRLAMSQMRGHFSDEMKELRDKLLKFTSMIELELDFSEEDVEFASRTDLKDLASYIDKTITHLVETFSLGNAIKNGVPVAIIGQTNAGKSTLLNYLVGEERAIVSEIHGTTRDVIEDTINIDGILFRFIDTAGIRRSTDRIENLGIQRTFQKLDQADIVLWIVDVTCPIETLEKLKAEILPKCEGKQLVIVFNKIDLVTDLTPVESLFKDVTASKIAISAKSQIHTTELKELLLKAAQIPQISQSDVIVTNVRHYEALSRALVAIKQVEDGLKNSIPGDLLAEDLHMCLSELGEITGTITSGEVLNNIFKNFCIGK
jgi:tRNA modification GTPase